MLLMGCMYTEWLSVQYMGSQIRIVHTWKWWMVGQTKQTFYSIHSVAKWVLRYHHVIMYREAHAHMKFYKNTKIPKKMIICKSDISHDDWSSSCREQLIPACVLHIMMAALLGFSIGIHCCRAYLVAVNGMKVHWIIHIFAHHQLHIPRESVDTY